MADEWSTRWRMTTSSSDRCCALGNCYHPVVWHVVFDNGTEWDYCDRHGYLFSEEGADRAIRAGWRNNRRIENPSLRVISVRRLEPSREG